MKILDILIFIVLAGLLFFWLKDFQSDQRQNEELKKLKENFESVVNYDSIISASEKRMFDSLKVVREEFEAQIKIQHDENTKLRRRNSALEKRFNDLDISGRPDF